MRRVLMVGLLALGVLGACGVGADGATSIVAQADEPGPVRLAPPDSATGAQSELVVQIDPGTFAARWAEAQATAVRVGGLVTSTSTGVVEERGSRYSYGTVTMEVPSDRLDATLETLASLGSVVSSNFRLIESPRSTSRIVATVTEVPSAVSQVDVPRARVATALDTAGDILLTMVAIAIVAGAVLIPLGLVLLVGLALWRRLSTGTVVAERPSASASDTTSEDAPLGA